MADNISIGARSGGASVAADDIGGVHHQRVKVQYGTDGSATDVSASNPLPVTAAERSTGSILDGRKTITTAGTPEALSGSSVPVRAVVITALSDNIGTIVIGSTTVDAAIATRRGTPLLSEDSIVLEDVNLDDIYVDVTDSGDGVSFTYIAT